MTIVKFIKQINPCEAVVMGGSVYKHQQANDYAAIKTGAKTIEVVMSAMTKNQEILRMVFFCEDLACVSDMLTKFDVDIKNPKTAMGTIKYKKMLRCPTVWIHCQDRKIDHWYCDGRLEMVR